jgi:site-specific DNA-methyltransferase (adenine-specific)
MVGYLYIYSTTYHVQNPQKLILFLTVTYNKKIQYTNIHTITHIYTHIHRLYTQVHMMNTTMEFSQLKEASVPVQTNPMPTMMMTREHISKEKICLVQGDCLEKMKNIDKESIDLILCDLPYGVTKNKWDVVIPFDALWVQYNRIIKKNGAIILFGSQPFTTMMIASNMKDFRYSLVWEKNKFSDFLNAKRKPMKTNEDICIFYKRQPTYNIQYWYSTPYERWNTQEAVDKQTNYGNHKQNVAKSDGKRLPTTILKFNRVERPKHPTQKPVDLLEWLIKSYTNEGENVLDNCMGIGSTGIAAKNLNRNFVGIELDETYFKMATEFMGELGKG